MKKLIVRGTLPVLLVASFAALGANVGGAATMMASHTWKGTVAKLGAMMGTSESFKMTDGSKTYTVDYKTSTKFVMGMASQVVVGAKVTVTGTLKGSTITASKLSI